MISTRRVVRLGTLVVLGAAAAGCVVLPYGSRDGRYGRGHRHLTVPTVSVPVVVEAPRERSERRGR